MPNDGLPPVRVASEESVRGKGIIERLEAGKLPQMVDWFDPGLLAKVGVRSVISATLGSYTDQRLIQASTDNADEDRLKNRYNYSGKGVITAGERPEKPKPWPLSEALPSTNGAVWVDYIADLGDGFEATYAMAYLLAADELKVRGEANPLPAGQLLIMGGDQVYPDATNQEYQDRLRDPYDWAFSTDDPKRKVFAIPGNHDWYDGLSAFSALFCSSRDRISRGIGARLGGWRCHQHRSYFAIKLPHDWWIWGPDIQLADNLDDSQRDYFDLMAEQTSEKSKIILCLAEPSWLHKNYDNMHEITMLARKKGAKICAVIAGDWHHYSRYTSEQLGIQFITAGGGGAFAHATHGLKRTIKLSWASPTKGERRADRGDSASFNRLEQKNVAPGGRNFTQQAPPPAQSASPTEVPEPKPSADTEPPASSRTKGVRKEEIRSAAYDCHATVIYPQQWLSRLLCMKNLTLPFRNRPFTYLVGIIYFVYAWAFVAADPRQSPIAQKHSAAIMIEMQRAEGEVFNHEQEAKRLRAMAADAAELAKTDTAAAPEVARLQTLAAKEDTALALEQGALAAAKKREAELQPSLRMQLGKIAYDPGLTTAAKISQLARTSLAFMFDAKGLLTAGEQSPMFAFMLIGLWAALVYYVESNSTLVRLLIGTAHALAHVTVLLFVSWFAQASGLAAATYGLMALGATLPAAMPMMLADGSIAPEVLRIIWNILVTLFFGGLLGGFVMGIYWTLTSTLLNMHTGDAFGALGIKDYKNFLRIKLEPDRATIYAIALDKVPGRHGWRWKLAPGEQRPSHNPQILPREALEPRLIEPPIAVDPQRVRS